MTDSICHSSLPHMVLEKVTLTTIKFRIYPRTKVDPMFYCVYISTPLKSYPYKSSVACLIYGESLRKPALIHVRTTKPQISAFVVHYSSFFFFFFFFFFLFLFCFVFF